MPNCLLLWRIEFYFRNWVHLIILALFTRKCFGFKSAVQGLGVVKKTESLILPQDSTFNNLHNILRISGGLISLFNFSISYIEVCAIFSPSLCISFLPNSWYDISIVIYPLHFISSQLPFNLFRRKRSCYFFKVEAGPAAEIAVFWAASKMVFLIDKGRGPITQQ